MRILLASSSSGSHGGGEIFLLYLGRALLDLGHTVGLWISDHERMTSLAESFARLGGDVIRVPYVNTYDLRGRCLTAATHAINRDTAIDSWRAWDPDIVHINKQNLEDGLDLLAAGKRMETPNICTIHISQSARYLRASNAWLRDLVSSYCLKRYPGILAAVADSRRDELSNFIPGNDSRVRRVYNGTPDPNLRKHAMWRSDKRAELGLDDDKLLITMVARLTAQKAPQHFLDIATEMQGKHDHLQFLWVGDGDFAAEWDQIVAQSGLHHSVKRIGWQDNVQPWLAATDAYLHTAAYEGLPLSILEALSFGLPTFLTPSMIGEVSAFNASDVCPIDSEGNWQGTLLDATRRSALADSARNLYDREFRVEKMAMNYTALYEEALHA
ncbi:MAG: glycosyltransferase involved in cell wall biosynthesis [Verrucomicrobiales bacterium]|jgi:glycosyltransferase involved in cell wall biosynthesis